eukprot:CAMPEP_0180297206 /NCGR_PEP_ID=MMETSP0988-20121125/20270_1 /TAXON_ID=697907 /ORGANISM="non described non described, Strain CCMP2293" /LENGTH=157 /DNA_ID=CAMNT_0022275559 /DNA_START=181 /DNA_END=650 /DNA_ORIENTATION=-
MAGGPQEESSSVFAPDPSPASPRSKLISRRSGDAGHLLATTFASRLVCCSPIPEGPTEGVARDGSPSSGTKASRASWEVAAPASGLATSGGFGRVLLRSLPGAGGPVAGVFCEARKSPMIPHCVSRTVRKESGGLCGGARAEEDGEGPAILPIPAAP